jgi:RNA polymerase sigma-70 factor (ECF subfamily)
MAMLTAETRAGRALMTSPVTESEILQRARDGDQDAFRLLVERYTTKVFSLARSILGNDRDAEDVVQEVFFKVHRRLETFREDARFSTWLYRVTFNAAFDRVKKRRTDRTVLAEDFQKLPVEALEDGPVERAARRDLQNEVRRAMAGLPEKFRTVLVLRELEGLAYEEISHTLGISKGTVESRLFRARARLKEALERAFRN